MVALDIHMMLFVTISFGILLIHFLLVYIFNGFTSACSLLIHVTCPYDRPQRLLVITSYDEVVLVLFGWFSSCHIVYLWMFFFLCSLGVWLLPYKLKHSACYMPFSCIGHWLVVNCWLTDTAVLRILVSVPQVLPQASCIFFDIDSWWRLWCIKSFPFFLFNMLVFWWALFQFGF